MRTLRQLCVDTKGSCRDQFFTVMGQVDDWEWEDLNLERLDQDKHVRNRTQTVLKAFSLGQLGCYQSPPPGTAAVGSDAAAPSGTETGWPTTPDDTLERLTNLQAQTKADLIAKNKANALMARDARMAADKQSSASGVVAPAQVFTLC